MGHVCTDIIFSAISSSSSLVILQVYERHPRGRYLLGCTIVIAPYVDFLYSSGNHVLDAKGLDG